MMNAVFCTVSTTTVASSIVNRLKDIGFNASDISVLAPAPDATRDLALKSETKAPEGVTTGVGAGALVGGGLGWLAGIGALAIPGVGPLIAAGPIIAALSGATIGGTLGGATGALVGMGIPEYEARTYEDKLETGHCLISVHSETSQQTELVKQIFKAAGGGNISTSSAPASISSR